MDEEYYTFTYCMTHDDGRIIKGNHLYVPDDYNMCNTKNFKYSKTCKSCDWYNMGIVKYNGYTIEVIEPVKINYDRYGGGFKFIYFNYSKITDETGHEFEKTTPSYITLCKWIEDTSKLENTQLFVK